MASERGERRERQIEVEISGEADTAGDVERGRQKKYKEVGGKRERLGEREGQRGSERRREIRMRSTETEEKSKGEGDRERDWKTESFTEKGRWEGERRAERGAELKGVNSRDRGRVISREWETRS